MEIKFEKLARKKAKLYVNFFGKSGCGKTYTALKVATNFASQNSKVLIIDTENRSHYYASDFEDVNIFNASNIKISELLTVISKAKTELGIEVVVIDSLTPFWDAMIEYADRQTKTSHGANWKMPKKSINAMTVALRNSGVHVITTSLGKDELNSKMEPTGKTLPCFERPKFEPYLDLQVILHNNGRIFEAPKQLHHSLSHLFIKDTQIDDKWCETLKEWLGGGVECNNVDKMSNFIDEVKNIEESESLVSGDQDAKYITETQLAELQQLIDCSTMDIETVCKLYNIDALPNLPVTDFDMLKQSLQNKVNTSTNSLL